MTLPNAENFFKDGMLLGVHPSTQPQGTTRKLTNFRVVTRDNNSFILTTVKGTELKSSLSASFVPVATADINGVAYILSHNPVTGMGEIGTFPSPASGEGGVLEHVYRPLYNYAGDDNSAAGKDAAFRSIHFNFDFENLVDIELQNDYDGSVNIIFTDGKNPIRIINCGFAVLPGGRFKRIDREGTKDTNRYSPKNFENIINLVAKSTKLMKVQFDASEGGGALPFGNWQYYFAYSTSDGAETEIISQSFSVPVIAGEKVASVSGGRTTGEKSSKMNRFTLSNLDESYAFVVAYAVHADGMLGQVKTAYRINQRFTIGGPAMSFVHTGYEQLIPVPINELIGEGATIDTAATIAQSQGHLMAADVKEKQHDVNLIRKFCRKIRVGHKEIKMDLIGPEDSLTRLFDENLNQQSIKGGTDAYNGGYANPKNVHDKVGYWGGEAYPFAARVLYNDGTTSPLFPVIGIDNVNNGALGTVDSATETHINALDATGGFRGADMLNNLGIYRFPNRNAPGVQPLFYREGAGNEGRVTVNGVTFKIPPTTDPDFIELKKTTVGIQFFRGERKPDCIIQGTMIDTQVIPLIRTDGANDETQGLHSYNKGKFHEENSKLIPAYGHILESLGEWQHYGNELGMFSSSGNYGDGLRRHNSSDDDNYRRGIIPYKLANNSNSGASGRDPQTVFSELKSPFALLSSDIAVNHLPFTGISRKDIAAMLLARISHRARVSSTDYRSQTNHFSLLAPEALATRTDQYSGKASWTPENMEAKNGLGFSSSGHFQILRGNSGYIVFRNAFNAYLGVRLNTNLKASSPAEPTPPMGELYYGQLNSLMDASFLANIYEGSGQRTRLAVQQIYQNIDGITYFPISGKMYWDSLVPDADPTNTLEGQLDANRKITLFGGDCFINFTLRRLFINPEAYESEMPDKNSVVRLGYTIGLINEGNFNAAFRSLETVDLVEGERKHPLQYAVRSGSPGDLMGKGNPWRDYYKLESAGYNKGYSMLSGNVPFVVMPKDIPYVRSHWFTRVWASAKHITNSFENGYRRFFARSYQDYPTKYGRIVKLMVNNNKLFCIQENSVGIIPMNERIQVGSDSAGPIYAESSGLLGPYMGMLSEEIGSRHKSSIVSTDNALYGYSSNRNVIWKTGEGQLVRISDLSIGSYMDDHLSDVKNAKVELLKHNVVTTWNKKFDEVLFSFYNKDGDSFETAKSFTVQFSEGTNKIHSFFSFIPARYMNVGEDLYSFDAASPFGIWLHDSLNDAVGMNTFYGKRHKATISYVVNVEPKTNKSYSHMELVSNFVKPEKIRYMLEGAYAEQEIKYIPGDVLRTNAKYKNRTWRITIPKITLVHNQDHEQAVPDTKAGAMSLLMPAARAKDRYMVVEVTYDTDLLIELESANTFFKVMR